MAPMAGESKPSEAIYPYMTKPHEVKELPLPGPDTVPNRIQSLVTRKGIPITDVDGGSDLTSNSLHVAEPVMEKGIAHDNLAHRDKSSQVPKEEDFRQIRQLANEAGLGVARHSPNIKVAMN